MDKITWCHLQSTSNEVIWPKKFLNSMHGLKSAILAILSEIGQLAGLACLVSAALHFRPKKMTGKPIKNELKLPSEGMPGLLLVLNQTEAVCIA